MASQQFWDLLQHGKNSVTLDYSNLDYSGSSSMTLKLTSLISAKMKKLKICKIKIWMPFGYSHQQTNSSYKNYRDCYRSYYYKLPII